MDESLRVALIQFLNQMGEAPDPASRIALMGDDDAGDGDLVIRFHTPKKKSCYAMSGVTELASFLLTYQVT